MPSLRDYLGVLAHDLLPFELSLRALGRFRNEEHPWIFVHNRDEVFDRSEDGRGLRPLWKFTSDLHIAKVVPSKGARLMTVAFEDWPVSPTGAAPQQGAPLATFIIGHRGMERLPHLLQTLRSIAGQTVAVECIVIEQSVTPEIPGHLPQWVRYIHTPVTVGFPYCRSWTLNVGAKLASTDALILHDNDMIVPRHYAAEVVGRMEEGWEFLDLKRFIFYLDEAETRRVFTTNEIRTAVPSTIVQNLQGASIATSRRAFFEIGGFDEAFVGWGGEDNDFWDRTEGRRVYGYGYLPFLHLFHAPQPGKFQGIEAPAVARYYQVSLIPAAERIVRLRQRDIGRLDRPFSE